jgi:hypothetical protein
MKTIGAIVAAVIMAGCAHAPTGPSVMVLPSAGKATEQFQKEDAACRQTAASELAASKGGNVSDQKRYDMTYLQCMYAQGNQVPVFNRPGYSTPYGSAPSTSTTVGPPPAGTPVPPAGTPPPPPPTR